MVQRLLQPDDGESDPQLASDDATVLIFGEVVPGGCISLPCTSLVIVGFVFPLLLLHFLNQNKFQMVIALLHPKQCGTGYSIFTPLVRERLCQGSWSWTAEYFQIQFYSLTPQSFLFLSVCVKSVLYSFTNPKNPCKVLFFAFIHCSFMVKSSVLISVSRPHLTATSC